MVLNTHIFYYSGDAVKFYVTYPGNGLARFESALYPGKYLILESGTGLRCDVPSNDTDLFTIIPILGESPAAYRQGNDCYMAFDSDGERYGPCGLSITNYEVEIALSQV